MPDPTSDSSVPTTPASAPPTASGQDMGGATLPARQFTAPSQTVIPPPAAEQSMSQIPSSSQISSMGSPSGMGGAARQFNAPPQTVVPQPPALSPDAQQSMAIGAAIKGVHSAMDPDQSKPGSIWRTVLSAALVGAAAGAGHGWKGAGLGAEAENKVMERQQQAKQDAEKQAQQQAQQKFQNDLATNKAKQEGELNATTIDLHKANIAQANLETLRINKAIQGMDAADHEKVAAGGKANVQPFVDAGFAPKAKGIPESEKAQYWTDHPGASTLDWEATGVKYGLDSNGKPTYELTYDAYDPTEKVTVSKATYNQWKNDKVFERFPEYDALLKDGRTLTADQYGQVKRDADKVRADNLTRRAQDLGVNKVQAEIDKDNAEKSKYIAEASKERQEERTANLGATQAQQFDKALEELNKKDGNFDALSPSSRIVISESMNKLVPTLNATYKEILSDPSNPNAQAEAGEVLKQIQSLSSLGTRAMSGMVQTPPPTTAAYVDAATGKQYNLPPDQVQAFLSTHPRGQKVESAPSTALPPGIPPIPKNYRGTRENWISAHQGNTTPPAAETTSMGVTPPNVPFNQLQQK